MGGGNWLTQSTPTNFHVFLKNKVLAKDESIEDWREVTDKEKQSLEASDAAWVRPDQSLIDRFNTLGAIGDHNGKFNEDTGFFECNGITDIGTEEASQMVERVLTSAGEVGKYRGVTNMRTNFCILSAAYYAPMNLREIVRNSDIQILRLSKMASTLIYTSGNDDNLNDSLGSAWNLKRIINPIEAGSRWCSRMTYSGGANLNIETLLLNNGSRSIGLANCPKLNYESFKYLVDNHSANSTITVTIHSDIYAALQGEAEYPFNGGTQEQWTQLMEDALNKNITFAS